MSRSPERRAPAPKPRSGERTKSRPAHPASGASEATLRAVSASWNRIFVIDLSSGRTLQATIEQLFLEDIVDVLAAPDPSNVPPAYRINVSRSSAVH
jgi:hypothetical protein